jgi:hypothetical protein
MVFIRYSRKPKGHSSLAFWYLNGIKATGTQGGLGSNNKAFDEDSLSFDLLFVRLSKSIIKYSDSFIYCKIFRYCLNSHNFKII